MHLRQGDLTAGQYAAKFDELSKYSSYLQSGPNEIWKSIQFERGLEFELRKAVAGFEIRDFASLVEKCLTMEECMTPIAETSQGTGKRKAEVIQPIRSTKKAKVEPCKTCGKQHQGTCRTITGVCFVYGQKGHIAKYCP